MKTGPLLLLFASSALHLGCSSVLCEDNGCCEGDADCCEGDACNPPVTRGVATPWESFGGELGAAPSGTLLLKLTSGEGFCAEPWVSELSCAGAWEADIPLPPSLQFAGAKAALSDLIDLGGGATFRRADPAEGDSCQMGEGGFPGDIEVVSINESYVTVRVTTTEQALSELEEEYTVPRCQNPELPQQAVAMVQSQFDAIYATKDRAGIGEPEPAITEPLHIFIDQSEPAASAVCEDPLGSLGECISRSTLQVVLGLDQQFPGTYTLASGVTVSSLQSTEAACLPASEEWTEGTVEVLAITPKLVHVRVTNGADLTVDAVATRCF